MPIFAGDVPIYSAPQKRKEKKNRNLNLKWWEMKLLFYLFGDCDSQKGPSTHD